MKSVNDSHLKAIARAIHFMRSGITSQMTTKFRDSIELDISKLDEIHRFCRQQIIEPGLPMSLDLESVGLHGELDGHTD